MQKLEAFNSVVRKGQSLRVLHNTFKTFKLSKDLENGIGFLFNYTNALKTHSLNVTVSSFNFTFAHSMKDSLLDFLTIPT